MKQKILVAALLVLALTFLAITPLTWWVGSGLRQPDGELVATVVVTGFNGYSTVFWHTPLWVLTMLSAAALLMVASNSIDEAFLSLGGLPTSQLEVHARQVKATVKQWTGIPVGVGVSATN